MRKILLLSLLIFCYASKGNSQISGLTGDKVILGPSEVIFGDTVLYSLNDILKEVTNVGWYEDEASFERISPLNFSKGVKIAPRLVTKDTKSKIKVIYDYLHVYPNPGWQEYVYSKEILIKAPSIINKENHVCEGSNVSFSLTNIKLPPDAIVKWTAGTNMSLISGQGTPNATFKASGNRYGTVKATITYNGKNYNLENSDVWIGRPGDVIGSQDPQGDFIQRTETRSVPANISGSDPDSYEWTKDKGSCKFVPFYDAVSITALGTKGSTIEFHVNASNRCGTYTKYFWFRVGEEEDPYLKSSIVNEDTRTESVEKEIKIYNLSSGLLVHTEKNVADFNIENTKLRAGIYIVEKTHEDGSVTREKVMKKY